MITARSIIIASAKTDSPNSRSITQPPPVLVSNWRNGKFGIRPLLKSRLPPLPPAFHRAARTVLRGYDLKAERNGHFDVNVPSGILNVEFLQDAVEVDIALIEKVMYPCIQRNPVVHDHQFSAHMQIGERVARRWNLLGSGPSVSGRELLIGPPVRV